MTAPETPNPPAQGRFIGWLLIAVGSLMVLLCGGCTLVGWGIAIFGLVQSPNAQTLGAMAGVVLMTTIIGGLPAAGGAVLVWAGLRTLRPLPQPGPSVAKTFD